MLKDFLNELSQKLLKIKIDFKTSNDEKLFLAGIKNLTGNTISDEDLLKYYNVWDEEEFKDNPPNVVTDIAGVQASFEQQIENIENSYLDNTPDSRFVQRLVLL